MSAWEDGHLSLVQGNRPRVSSSQGLWLSNKIFGMWALDPYFGVQFLSRELSSLSSAVDGFVHGNLGLLPKSWGQEWFTTVPTTACQLVQN